MTVATITNTLKTVFKEEQAQVLAKVIWENIAEDFFELKEIVKGLAEAQQRTETKMEGLAEAQKRTETKMEELAEAQKRTEIKMEELAEAQKRTEIKMEELAEAQKKTELTMQELAREIKTTRVEIGGLGKSMGYSLENEAFRMLPAFLEKRHNIVMTEKLIRQDIQGREINILGKGKKEGQDVVIVGEATLRLDQREKLGQLEESVHLVAKMYPGMEIIPLLVTHYAPAVLLEKAKDKGVIVIQSFEWV